MQHLDRAANLVVAADDGVELLLLGARRQIDRVLLERFALLFGVLVVDLTATANLVDRFRDCAFDGARFLEDSPEVALRLQRREQEELARDVAVAALLRELIRDVQELAQLVADVDFARCALDTGQAIERIAKLRAQ